MAFCIDNLSIFHTDNHVHLPGVFGEGPYPSSQQVSRLAWILDGGVNLMSIDLGSS